MIPHKNWERKIDKFKTQNQEIKLKTISQLKKKNKKNPSSLAKHLHRPHHRKQPTTTHHRPVTKRRRFFERLNLLLQELQIMNRLIQHRRRVQFRAAGDHSLKNPHPLAYPLAAAAGRHALRVLRDPDVLPPRWVRDFRVDLDRLHHRHAEDRLSHRLHRVSVLE